jgi:predicted aconitase with swiveling domain
MGVILKGKALVPGEAVGELLVANEPLSFWGGYDPVTGEIIDRRHPLSGSMAAGRILAVPFTRGSSTSTAILLESVRSETRPAAILCTASDPFLALAAIVADELYKVCLPVIMLERSDFEKLQTGIAVRIETDGSVVLNPE